MLLHTGRGNAPHIEMESSGRRAWKCDRPEQVCLLHLQAPPPCTQAFHSLTNYHSSAVHQAQKTMKPTDNKFLRMYCIVDINSAVQSKFRASISKANCLVHCSVDAMKSCPSMLICAITPDCCSNVAICDKVTPDSTAPYPCLSCPADT